MAGGGGAGRWAAVEGAAEARPSSLPTPSPPCPSPDYLCFYYTAVSQVRFSSKIEFGCWNSKSKKALDVLEIKDSSLSQQQTTPTFRGLRAAQVRFSLTRRNHVGWQEPHLIPVGASSGTQSILSVRTTAVGVRRGWRAEPQQLEALAWKLRMSAPLHISLTQQVVWLHLT